MNIDDSAVSVEHLKIPDQGILSAISTVLMRWCLNNLKVYCQIFHYFYIINSLKIMYNLRSVLDSRCDKL